MASSIRLHLLSFGVAILGLFWLIPASGQGTFRNLDFEAATLVPVVGDPNSVQFAQAFPGWTGLIGNAQQTTALYNTLFLDTSALGIIDAHAGFASPIQGAYTAMIESGFLPGTSQLANGTLEQVGSVPAGTQSLLFSALNPGSGSFSVSLGTQPLNLVTLQSSANYKLYGADIHSFAGQTALLAFTVSPTTPFSGDGILFLDGISFSTQPIPEPGSLAMLLLGVVLVAWRHSGFR